MKVTSKVNTKNLNLIKKDMINTLVETADAVLSDLKQSETMPFDTGELQNRNTFVDDSKKNQGKVSIVSDNPKARRLYFHPEYNFKKDKNKNAGGEWFDPYIDGKKKDFAKKSFKRLSEGKYK